MNIIYNFTRKNKELLEEILVEAKNEDEAWKQAKEKTAGKREEFEVTPMPHPLFWTSLVVF